MNGALFATTLPDINDRTLASSDRLGVTWDEAAHAMQQISACRFRHEKAARYGEARPDAPAALEGIRRRLADIHTQLAALAADAQRDMP
jgi:hypothetical protein